MCSALCAGARECGCGRASLALKAAGAHVERTSTAYAPPNIFPSDDCSLLRACDARLALFWLGLHDAILLRGAWQIARRCALAVEAAFDRRPLIGVCCPIDGGGGGSERASEQRRLVLRVQTSAVIVDLMNRTLLRRRRRRQRRRERWRPWCRRLLRLQWRLNFTRTMCDSGDALARACVCEWPPLNERATANGWLTACILWKRAPSFSCFFSSQNTRK